MLECSCVLYVRPNCGIMVTVVSLHHVRDVFHSVLGGGFATMIALR